MSTQPHPASTTSASGPTGPAPAAAAPALPPPPRTYPRLIYRAKDENPGYEVVRVNSADEEETAHKQAADEAAAAVTVATAAAAAAVQWYDTPGEAQAARVAAHMPWVEYGHEGVLPTLETAPGLKQPAPPPSKSAHSVPAGAAVQPAPGSGTATNLKDGGKP
ncbi:MAG TPA: hypothetical protein VGJ10_06065 [Paraburkholderia sp.]|jgi:hypothetical protein